MTPIRQIQALAADRYGITVVDLLAQGRRQKFVLPRHLAIFLAHTENPGISLSVIAREFRRDHTTVLYAITRIERRLRTDGDLVREVAAMRTVLEWRAAA